MVPPQPSKKRKQPEPNNVNGSLQTPKDNAAAIAPVTAIHVAPVRFDLKIQQAKKSAVVQAQQEGCLGNYRSFDSPFGNYLLPVIPTHSDLFG